MAKKGMARRPQDHAGPDNPSPVPELQGKEKRTKAHAKPIISGTSGAGLKVFHR